MSLLALVLAQDAVSVSHIIFVCFYWCKINSVSETGVEGDIQAKPHGKKAQFMGYVYTGHVGKDKQTGDT